VSWLKTKTVCRPHCIEQPVKTLTLTTFRQFGADNCCQWRPALFSGSVHISTV
jgi:hypothetical protein